MDRYFQLASVDLVVFNRDAWSLLWDFAVLRQIFDTIPGNTALQNEALVANEIMNVFRRGDPTDIKNVRKLAECVFGKSWEAKTDSVYTEGGREGASLAYRELSYRFCSVNLTLRTIIAWILLTLTCDRLWPYRATQQKVARSWSTDRPIP